MDTYGICSAIVSINIKLGFELITANQAKQTFRKLKSFNFKELSVSDILLMAPVIAKAALYCSF